MQVFQFHSSSGLAWLACRRLERLPWLLHAFSTRRGGVSEAPAAGLNLGFVETDQRERVEENRRRFFDSLGARDFSLAHLRQVHSATVYQVMRGAEGGLEYRPSGYPLPAARPRLPAGDALVTDQPGILLSVRGADCLTALLVDPNRPAVAAVHAGWRGALQRIAEKPVGVMRRLFDSDPKRIIAVLGPSIRACCYEVGEEVVSAFSGVFVHGEKFFRYTPREHSSGALAARSPMLSLSSPPPGHGPEGQPVAHLDLVAAVREQLQHAGIRPSNVLVADSCTACRTDLFFSHRKEGKGTGRTMAVIGIRPPRER